jgi:lipocalin
MPRDPAATVLGIPPPSRALEMEIVNLTRYAQSWHERGRTDMRDECEDAIRQYERAVEVLRRWEASDAG